MQAHIGEPQHLVARPQGRSGRCVWYIVGPSCSYGPLRPPYPCMGMIFGTRAQPRGMSSKFSDEFWKLDPCKTAGLAWVHGYIFGKWTHAVWRLAWVLPSSVFCVVQPCRVLFFPEKTKGGLLQPETVFHAFYKGNIQRDLAR